MTLSCVALRTTRYSDHYDILAVYSRESGRLSLLIPAGTGKEARRIRALTQPLSVFACVADIRPNKEIHPISQCAPIGTAGADISANPVKTAVALFLAEVLTALLRESPADATTFDYIDQAINRLATGDDIANFHICFLYHIARHIGIAPDISTFAEGRLFDLQNARFVNTPPLHNNYLNHEESGIFHNLSRMTFDNMRAFRFNRTQRSQILDLILRYYTLHYASLSSLKSLPILQSLFD